MIPYIKVPDLHLGPLTLHPFGILVATGVLVGTALASRRAKWLGYDLFYHWDEVVKRPYSLLFLWEGLSSFGGFVGALIGILLWKRLDWNRGLHVRKHVLPVFPFADLVLAVFPVAWIFGRSGCSVVHDHRGARAPAGELLSVTYPFDEHNITEKLDKYGPIQLVHGSVPRYDLGLIELMFTCILALFFAMTWRRKLPVGTYIVATAFSYAPVRFVMDFLRVPESEGGDTRYARLTPAQWCCTALFLLGVGVVVHMVRIRRAKIDVAEHLRAIEVDAPVVPEAPLVR
jgi:phosphatidylglycerol---prolipoprotein diacylglyceryl transferase